MKLDSKFKIKLGHKKTYTRYLIGRYINILKYNLFTKLPRYIAYSKLQ